METVLLSTVLVELSTCSSMSADLPPGSMLATIGHYVLLLMLRSPISLFRALISQLSNFFANCDLPTHET